MVDDRGRVDEFIEYCVSLWVDGAVDCIEWG